MKIMIVQKCFKKIWSRIFKGGGATSGFDSTMACLPSRLSWGKLITTTFRSMPPALPSNSAVTLNCPSNCSGFPFATLYWASTDWSFCFPILIHENSDTTEPKRPQQNGHSKMATAGNTHNQYAVAVRKNGTSKKLCIRCVEDFMCLYFISEEK